MHSSFTGGRDPRAADEVSVSHSSVCVCFHVLYGWHVVIGGLLPCLQGHMRVAVEVRRNQIKEKRLSNQKTHPKPAEAEPTAATDPMVHFVYLLSALRSSTFKEGMRRLKEHSKAEINSSYAQIHILGSDSRMKLCNEIKRHATYAPEVAVAHKRVIYRFCSAYIHVLLKFCCDLPPDKSPLTDSNRDDILDIVEDDEEDNFLDVVHAASKLWADESIKKVHVVLRLLFGCRFCSCVSSCMNAGIDLLLHAGGGDLRPRYSLFLSCH